MVNSICNEMYSKLPNLVLGFHGCHKDVFDSVVKGGQHLKRKVVFTPAGRRLL